MDRLQSPGGTQELTRLRKTRYLGSHPSVAGQAEDIDVVFTTSGVEFRSGKVHLGAIPWASVSDLAADTREGVERRLTATRLVLLGALALLAKKETQFAYLLIQDDRGEWIFAVPGLTAVELDSGLRALRKRLSMPPRAAEGTKRAPAERLSTLTQLHRDGLLTDHEYETRRREIINEL